MRIIGVLTIVLLAAVATLVYVLVVVTHGAVSRSRVERFARRQRLAITPGNGDSVIRYLATTRRWRAWGLLLGGLLGVLWSLRDHQVRIDFTALFAGWFVGAVVAEWRVTSLASGSRHSARLARRTRRDYLGPAALMLPIATAVLCVGLASAGILGAARRTPHELLPIVAWAAASIAGLGVIWMVQRHILLRAQPQEAADVLAADDAVRARSLHVLSGAAVAAGGIPAASLLSLAGEVFTGWDAADVGALSLLLLFAAALTGWLLGMTSSPVPTQDNDDSSLPVGGVISR